MLGNRAVRAEEDRLCFTGQVGDSQRSFSPFDADPRRVRHN
jgi:hypothetical protein